MAMQQRLTYEAMKALVARKLNGELKKTHIIDVRDPEELEETGIIPTALNIPLNQLEAALNSDQQQFLKMHAVSKPLPDETLVLYCKKGMRAEKAAELAVRCGYERADIFPGSWDEWSMHMDDSCEKRTE